MNAAHVLRLVSAAFVLTMSGRGVVGVVSGQEPRELVVRTEQMPYPATASGPVAFAVDGAGRLFATHPSDGVVRMWSQSGAMEKSPSLRAHGPDFPWAIGFTGETLWLADRYARHLVRFRGDWEGGGTTALALPGRSGELHSRGILGVVAADRLLVETTASGLAMALSGNGKEGVRERIPGPLMPADIVTHLPVWLTDLDGSVLDTILSVSAERWLTVLIPPDGEGPEGIRFALAKEPFGDPPLLAVDPAARHIVIVDRRVSPAGAATFTLHRIAVTGDTLRTTIARYVPIDLDASWVEAAAEKEALDLSESVQEGARAARAAFYIPPWLPPVSEVQVDRNGWIWLRREDVPEASQVAWEIWDEHDRRLGRVRLDRSLAIVAVHGLSAWAYSRNEGKVELFRLCVGSRATETVTC